MAVKDKDLSSMALRPRTRVAHERGATVANGCGRATAPSGRRGDLETRR